MSPLRSITALGIVTALLSAGCGKSSTQGHTREFRPSSGVPDSENPLPGFTLHNLDTRLPGLRKYSVMSRQIDLSDLKEPKDSPRGTDLTVSFSGLTEQECNEVKSVYSVPWQENLSQLACSDAGARKNLSLQNFLSPFMQAALSLTYAKELYLYRKNELDPASPKDSALIARFDGKASATEWYQFLETNCWSTAYEVGRYDSGQTPKAEIHTVGLEEVDKIFTSPTYTKVIRQKSPIDSFKVSSVQDYQFGDIIIIRNKFFIVHVATVIDRNLVFEKVGNATGLPYRLVDFDSSFFPYKNNPRWPATIEIRRQIRPFPSVRDIPDLQLFNEWTEEKTLNRYEALIKVVPLLRKGNLFQFPEQAFQRSTTEPR